MLGRVTVQGIILLIRNINDKMGLHRKRSRELGYGALHHTCYFPLKKKLMEHLAKHILKEFYPKTM